MTAVVAVQDRAVRVRFSNIYWLTVGADAVGERILALQAMLYKQLTGKGMQDDKEAKDEHERQGLLVEAMADKQRSLLVLDDPWMPEQVRFLNPIDGTPLAGQDDLTPQYCLRALAMFRFVNPDCEIRIAGGRELHLGSLQPLGLYAANSLFVGDYLTTSGQAPEKDEQMIREMGFETVIRG